MALFRNRVFGEVLKVSIEMGSYCILISNANIFLRDRKGYAEIEIKVL